MGLKNFYGSLHGGAVAAVAEMVSVACARTVVPEDKELSLGEMSISYLSGAPKNVSFTGITFCSSGVLCYVSLRCQIEVALEQDMIITMPGDWSYFCT